MSNSTNDSVSRLGIWIPATDPARARKFYSAVLDWDCKEKGYPSQIAGIKETYMFTKGPKISGCFCVMEGDKIARAADEGDKARVGVHIVFDVKDIAETLDLVVKNGGQIHVGKTSMGPHMGFIARFIDSEGNLMGLYSFN